MIGASVQRTIIENQNVTIDLTICNISYEEFDAKP